jgi:hypothetical protein
VPVVALVGAGRLAKPGSPWARRRYDDATRRRAEQRFSSTRAISRAGRRLADLIAGAPNPPDR